jgi:ElaB/YqjD/DUF883 family membrane-anchored ribosome-binding protein
MENNHQSMKKFEEALQLLNDAAREKKEEIQSLIGDKYAHIREVVEDATKKGRKTLRRAKGAAEEWVGEGEESLREVVSDLDDKVHENPWAYLGGVAVGALLLGFILGSSSRNK